MLLHCNVWIFFDLISPQDSSLAKSFTLHSGDRRFSLLSERRFRQLVNLNIMSSIPVRIIMYARRLLKFLNLRSILTAIHTRLSFPS